MTSHTVQKYHFGRVEQFVRDLDIQRAGAYLDYWESIRPRDFSEYYDRWIFAFMSIHTTWKRNVEGYLAVKALPQRFNRQQLYRAIRRAKCGLDKMRTHAIWDFHRRYWSDPIWWYPKADESLPDCRDRLAKSTFGIGLTKTSFVLEMAFPSECNVVCLDTHILQLYDYYRKDTPNLPVYRAMEKHWIDTCAQRQVPSPIVRHLYWDGVQKKENTRYWSYVLEQSVPKIPKKANTRKATRSCTSASAVAE